MTFKWKMMINLSQETCHRKLSGSFQASTPSLFLSVSLWIDFQWLGGLLSCVFQIIWLLCMLESDSMHLPMCIYTLSFTCIFLEHMWMCLYCCTALCTFLLCLEDSYASVLFFFFVFFCCGYKSSRLSQPSGLGLTTARMPALPAGHCNITQGSCGSCAACEWSCSSGLMSSTLSNSPLLCSMLGTLQYVVFFRRGPKRKYN